MHPTARHDAKIEITGTQDLAASDRALFKFLCQYVCDRRDLSTESKIPLTVIPWPHSNDEHRDLLLDSLNRLTSVRVNAVQP